MTELSSTCEAIMQTPSEERLVALLDQWSPQWTWRGRQRAIGAGAYERYCTLGLYAFGGNAPNVSKASSMKEACIAVNRFMRHRFPHGTWTSIAVLLNPRIGLHRDMQNMVGKLNHAITLGTFNGGRVWIEDEEGTSIETTRKNGKVRELKGTWIDIHDKPMSFNARRFHKIEPHEGHMWALAACTPQLFERCSDEVRSKKLRNLSFRVLMKIQNKIEYSMRAINFVHGSSFMQCSLFTVITRIPCHHEHDLSSNIHAM